MTANCTVQQDDTTAGMKGATPDSVIMTPASDVSQTFSVGPNCVWLMAHGLTGTDTIRVMMVSGPGAGTHVTPFRPTGADPVEDVVLSVGRTSLPIYYPGRYRLERLVGATAATVYMIKTMVAHDAGTFYNEVTGDTVVNTIDAGTISPAFDVDFDPTSGDVVFDLSLNIDPDADNLVTEQAGGISVIAVNTVSPLDTATINMTVTQTDPNIAVVSGDVRISANAGNAVTAVADGLFVATPATAITEIDAVDSPSIDITIGPGGAATERTISADLIINSAAGKGSILAVDVNGVYANSGAASLLLSCANFTLIEAAGGLTSSARSIDAVIQNNTLYTVVPGTSFPSPWTLTSGGMTRIRISWVQGSAVIDPLIAESFMGVGLGSTSGGTERGIYYVPSTLTPSSPDPTYIAYPGSKYVEINLLSLTQADPIFITFLATNFSADISDIRIAVEYV